MFNYLKSFLVNYQFPTECSNALVDAYNILEMKDKIKELERVANLYKLEEEPQYEELALEVEKLSKDSNIHVYTLWLIVLILMSKTLHDRYRSLSYPDYIFDYSMLDIRYKAVECHLVKGIWGNFVSSWEYCFFKMKLFGFNSLQFEPIKLEKDYEVDGNIIKQGESLLSVHIPRREKHLDEKEVERDFELAKEFFKDKVDHLFFYCHSWLLFPKNKEILSSSSHLRHFIDLFTLLDTYEAPNYSEMWRLFDMEIDENNLDSLPTNTSFRRGYVELMKNKEKTGGGVGIYIPKRIMKTVTCYNGVAIPNIGLGTWQIDNEHIYDSFNSAIEVGYRHFDSAQGYFNEENLGRAVKDSSVKREDLFITTKVMDTYKTYEEAKASIEESLRKLQTEYIDLVLIHCPNPWDVYPDPDPKWDVCNVEVWRAMVEFYKLGKIKAIGVSNFSIHEIQNLIDNSDVKPMVNQVPVYIGKTNWELINFCKENNIVVQAYSPIAHGKILNNEVVKAMADKYNCSIAQLCIAYVTQIGLVALPKTLNPAHMKSNLEINFVINDEDLEYLKQLKLNVGW